MVSVFAVGLAGFGVVARLRAFEPDCTVTVGTRTIDLDQDTAEAVSTAVAAVVRRSGSTRDAVAAVLDHSDLSGNQADVVAGALTGRAKAALSCRHGWASDSEAVGLGSDGLTHRAERVRKDMEAHFGNLPLGGFAPGGVHSGHMVGSAHYEGRAIDTFFRPIDAAN